MELIKKLSYNLFFWKKKGLIAGKVYNEVCPKNEKKKNKMEN